MTPFRISSTVFLALLLAACDEPGSRADDGVEAGGKADDAEGVELDPEIQQTHLSAVGSCEGHAVRARAHTSALRYVERTEIEQERLTCIATANDAVRSAVSQTLQSTSPMLAAEVDDAFNVWRSESNRLCDALVDAHELANEKSISAVEVGCAAEAELRLAQAVEVFADLGGTRAAVPDAALLHPSCHALYVEALDDLGAAESSEIPEDVEATQSRARIDAQQTLADCIEDELAANTPVLVERIIATYPGRVAEQIRTGLERDFEVSADGIGSVCALLGYAATDGGELAVQTCRTAAAMWRHELLGYLLPALGPTDSGSAEDGEEPDADE